MKEIDLICSAFIWSDPELSSRKAKVAWVDCCLPHKECGFGLQLLKQGNMVNGLKLIWKMILNQSLSGKWVNDQLICHKCFWEISDHTQMGF